MTRLEAELAHLINLLSPNFREAWKPYVWAKANELAKDSEMQDLPRLLSEHMRSLQKEAQRP